MRGETPPSSGRWSKRAFPNDDKNVAQGGADPRVRGPTLSSASGCKLDSRIRGCRCGARASAPHNCSICEMHSIRLRPALGRVFGVGQVPDLYLTDRNLHRANAPSRPPSANGRSSRSDRAWDGYRRIVAASMHPFRFRRARRSWGAGSGSPR
jgi:hypothetical protein